MEVHVMFTSAVRSVFSKQCHQLLRTPMTATCLLKVKFSS